MTNDSTAKPHIHSPGIPTESQALDERIYQAAGRVRTGLHELAAHLASTDDVRAQALMAGIMLAVIEGQALVMARAATPDDVANQLMI